MTHRPPKCEECAVEMVPLPERSSDWVCPECGRKIHNRIVQDEMSCENALGLHGTSSEQVDGIPVKESRRDVTPNGEGFAADIDRSPEGGQAERKFRLLRPYVRDAKGDAKKREERECVNRMLAKYNEQHGTSYRRVRSDEEDRDTDVIAESDDSDPDLGFQIVMADEAIWKPLSKRGELEEYISEDELLQRMQRAIESKMTRADLKIVLVLDGPWATAHGTVTQFQQKFQTFMNAADFKEIWYCGRGPGGPICMLRGQGDLDKFLNQIEKPTTQRRRAHR